MATDNKTLTPEQLTLVAAQDGLRKGRQLLEILTSTLLGVTTEPPNGSRIMEVLTEMRAAQAQVSEALLKTVSQEG